MIRQHRHCRHRRPPRADRPPRCPCAEIAARWPCPQGRRPVEWGGREHVMRGSAREVRFHSAVACTQAQGTTKPNPEPPKPPNPSLAPFPNAASNVVHGARPCTAPSPHLQRHARLARLHYEGIVVGRVVPHSAPRQLQLCQDLALGVVGRQQATRHDVVVRYKLLGCGAAWIWVEMGVRGGGGSGAFEWVQVASSPSPRCTLCPM